MALFLAQDDHQCNRQQQILTDGQRTWPEILLMSIWLRFGARRTTDIVLEKLISSQPDSHQQGVDGESLQVNKKSEPPSPNWCTCGINISYDNYLILHIIVFAINSLIIRYF